MKKKDAYFQFRKKFDSETSLDRKVDLLWYFAEIYRDGFKAEISDLPEKELKICFNENHLNGDMVSGVILSCIYADQFDNEKYRIKKAGGKKIKKSNLKKILADISQFGTASQKTKLPDAFNNRKGDLEQVDDVCIIGIRI